MTMSANDRAMLFNTVLHDTGRVEKLAHQQQIAGMPFEYVLEHQAAGLATRIGHLSWMTKSDADKLTETINGAPFTMPQRTHLAKVILDMEGASTHGDTSKPKRRRAIHDTSIPRVARITQMTARLWSVGVITVVEKLCWRVASIICFVDGATASTDCVEIYKEVKRAMQNETTKPHPLPFIEEFPDDWQSDFQEKHADHYDYAYDAMDPASTQQ